MRAHATPHLGPEQRAVKPSNAERPFTLIGELINHSFARARNAWKAKSVEGYQALARIQTERGADYLTLNIDGTQSLAVTLDQMNAFLPELVPALQDVTPLPISFDNPDVAFHREALKHYDRSKSPQPVLNSVAASRDNLDEMFALAKEYDTKVIVMASEKFATKGGGEPCKTAEDVYQVTRRFVQLLAEKADRTTDQIIVDPGLAPVAADTFGIVNMGLDAIRMIRNDPELAGIHLSVGLTNFSFGTPREIRENLENAYITLAVEAGLDFILGNPEKDLKILDPDDPTLCVVREALELGRPKNGQSQMEAGFDQSEKIMDLY